MAQLASKSHGQSTQEASADGFLQVLWVSPLGCCFFSFGTINLTKLGKTHGEDRWHFASPDATPHQRLPGCDLSDPGGDEGRKDGIRKV